MTLDEIIAGTEHTSLPKCTRCQLIAFRAELEEMLKQRSESVSRCIGYPECDGDLVGLEHEVRAALSAAMKDIEDWWPNLEMEGFDSERALKLIEQHITPLLRSVRIAAIEECAQASEKLHYATLDRTAPLKGLGDVIRALKEQP